MGVRLDVQLEWLSAPFSLTHTSFFPIVSKWGKGLSEGGRDDVCRPEDVSKGRHRNFKDVALGGT
jgi:hypothetical protein